MSIGQHTILWDFDGTLAYRHSVEPTLKERQALAAPCPGIDLRPERFTALRKSTTIDASGDWDWMMGKPMAKPVFQSLGYNEMEAAHLADFMRSCYRDPAHWCIFEDSKPVLQQLKELSWTQIIVSNHVPAELASALGLLELVDHFVSTEQVGSAKPEPAIYQHAVSLAVPYSSVWMAGDDCVNDVLVPGSLGIKGVLVRSDDPRAPLRFATLYELLEYLQRYA